MIEGIVIKGLGLPFSKRASLFSGDSFSSTLEY